MSERVWEYEPGSFERRNVAFSLRVPAANGRSYEVNRGFWLAKAKVIQKDGKQVHYGYRDWFVMSGWYPTVWYSESLGRHLIGHPTLQEGCNG